MTRREAKRQAAHHVGMLIDCALGGGWEPGAELGLGEEDLERVLDGVLEIEDEMRRRGWRAEIPKG